jgi:hypothetical protein
LDFLGFGRLPTSMSRTTETLFSLVCSGHLRCDANAAAYILGGHKALDQSVDFIRRNAMGDKPSNIAHQYHHGSVGSPVTTSHSPDGAGVWKSPNVI